MRALRVLITTVLTAALLCAAAYAAGWAVFRADPTAATPEQPVAEAPDRLPEEPQETVTAAPPLRPAFRLEPGDRGRKVRELQSRLHQLAWLPELTTGRYDAPTAEAVRGFQDKRGVPVTAAWCG